MSKYNHSVKQHNLEAPSEIVPIVIKLINPLSVVDIGCGLGTFLNVFKREGVVLVKGVDGPWCKTELLFQNIDQDEFIEQDMESSIKLDQRFDLAVCLEVAEHLSSHRANSFIEDLVAISDVILFSAAIPKQGGDHHLNEQWLSYWEVMFKQHDYLMYDVLRPIFWDNKKIFWWYRQNMVLFIKSGKQFPAIELLPKNIIKNIIHPELYTTIVDYKEVNAVKRSTRALVNSILYKLKVIR